MKKNKLFIAGLVTVFVALCSLTLVSSTWAKYTSTASGSDSARVAYWGFKTTSITIDDLFKKAYDSSVQSTVDVIAPGTSSSAPVTFQPEGGNPEVSYRLTYELEYVIGADLKAKLNANTSFQWTLQVGTGTVNKYQTIEELKTEVEKLSKDYAPNTAPESGTITIGWEWDFNGPADNFANDTLDTELGNLADSLGNIEITLSVTATQID